MVEILWVRDGDWAVAGTGDAGRDQMAWGPDSPVRMRMTSTTSEMENLAVTDFAGAGGGLDGLDHGR